MSKFLSKKQTVNLFLSEYNTYLCEVAKGDRVAKRCAWLDFVDALCKNRQVSQAQFNNWTNPFDK